MSEPHVIRLRGPWELTPLERWTATADGPPRVTTDELPAGGKTPVPGDWAGHLGQEFCGKVRYLRRFHSPTNLDLSDRVWLVCQAVDARGVATLNDVPLFAGQEPSGPWSQDVTELLRARNRLVIDVELSPADLLAESPRRSERMGQAGGLPGEVRLEIRSEE